MNDSQNRPTAASDGPTVMGSFGPTRPTSRALMAASAPMVTGDRQKRDPCLERTVAQDVPDELGEEEEHREDRRADGEHHRVGAGAVAVGKDVQRHERMRASLFDERKPPAG